jgi:hypothetical protein
LIISHIIGGLGNQMFQYAAGRALSLKRGDQFRLDVSDFSGYSLHQGFELQRVFGCVGSFHPASGGVCHALELRHFVAIALSQNHTSIIGRK